MRTALLSAAALLAMSATASAEITLRFADGGPNRGTRAKTIMDFFERAEQATNGEVSFEEHWGGALLKFDAMLAGLDAGTADLGPILAAYEPKKMIAMAFADIPTKYADPWVGGRAVFELLSTNEQIQASFAKSNVRFLFNFPTGGAQIECQGAAVRTADDVSGKNIRVSGTLNKVFADLGATTATMTYGKAYQALDSGLMDCGTGYSYTNVAYKIYEVIDSYTLADLGQIGGFGIFINMDSWSDISEEGRAAITELSEQMLDDYARAQIETHADVQAKLKNGELGDLEYIVMSEEERGRILAGAQKYIDSWIAEVSAEGVDGQAVWDQYVALLEKYSAEVAEKGYPWTR